MADYHPLIARAVAGLEKNTGENRRALYERARTALVAQLARRDAGARRIRDHPRAARARRGDPQGRGRGRAARARDRAPEPPQARRGRRAARSRRVRRRAAAERAAAPADVARLQLAEPAADARRPNRAHLRRGELWRMRRCANSARRAATRNPGSRPGAWTAIRSIRFPSRRRRRRTLRACRSRLRTTASSSRSRRAGKPVGVAARWIAAGGARGLRSTGAAAPVGGTARGG